MKINAINTYNPIFIQNKNPITTQKSPSFGYGGDEISPVPDSEFKDLTGGNGRGSTKETIKLIFQIPIQIIKESLGIQPRKNPNEEDPEDFFKTVYPTVVEDDTLDYDLDEDDEVADTDTDASDEKDSVENNQNKNDIGDDNNDDDNGILMLVG